MINNQFFLKLRQLRQSHKELLEVTELIEISRSIFREKITDLQLEILGEKNDGNKRKIIEKVEKLYEQYQETLWLIEKYIEEFSENMDFKLPSRIKH